MAVRIALWAVLVLVLTLLAAQVWLARSFGSRIAAAEARLLALPPGAIRSDLPPPVEAFARRAGATGTPRAVVATQTARLRSGPDAAFATYEARQISSVAAAGFVWDAAQRIGPLNVVRVVDQYVAGEGLLEARLLGAIPVARGSGPDVALGEALRYLAELPWTPDAILANRSVAWRLLPDGRAEARLDTVAGPAVVRFAFDEAGDIVAMEAPARPVAGSSEPMEWRGRFWDYRMVGPRRIPARGAVGYVYPTGYADYFEGEVTSYALVE
ncbi:DUF6544 family protein [Rubellimicrobium sp. CFH 75288]|uniref:DUF6544 family protein n=1 Tax=Rubellimicrobium sp. CFH 75288 TaxID=2697034 RepID=UPI001413443B|nr:DUF6544 family protein [Rubellimicrobium sp. CFH 75288]NAZ37063.1 hypothetical protein [Rubellimicrobium sp. CFH 75288]